MTKNQANKLSAKQLKRIIMEDVGESDWGADEIVKKCILPYLDKKTLLEIAWNHFGSLEEQ